MAPAGKQVLGRGQGVPKYGPSGAWRASRKRQARCRALEPTPDGRVAGRGKRAGQGTRPAPHSWHAHSSHLCLPVITTTFTLNSQYGLRLIIQPGNACVDKATSPKSPGPAREALSVPCLLSSSGASPRPGTRPRHNSALTPLWTFLAPPWPSTTLAPSPLLTLPILRGGLGFQSLWDQQAWARRDAGLGCSCFGPSKAPLAPVASLPFLPPAHRASWWPTKPTPGLEEEDKVWKLARPEIPPTSLRAGGDTSYLHSTAPYSSKVTFWCKNIKNALCMTWYHIWYI